MRRARIESDLTDADVIADALRPDDTMEIETRVDDGTIVTVIERETTRGLQSTLDDYVVNLGVATRVAQHANHTIADGPADDADTTATDTEHENTYDI